mmetsp:Transcript_27143/g.72894  ORF Transcript_27143/g.72894 Transcript_27143/m.72894 type:complete len:436 (+) Transcript_27143:62-1369(+)
MPSCGWYCGACSQCGTPANADDCCASVLQDVTTIDEPVFTVRTTGAPLIMPHIAALECGTFRHMIEDVGASEAHVPFSEARTRVALDLIDHLSARVGEPLAPRRRACGQRLDIWAAAELAEVALFLEHVELLRVVQDVFASVLHGPAAIRAALHVALDLSAYEEAAAQRPAFCEHVPARECYTWEGDVACGAGHDQPQLNSTTAWCAGNDQQWLGIMLPALRPVVGVVLQGRNAGNSWEWPEGCGNFDTGNSQYVERVEIEVSVDGKSYWPIGEHDAITQSPHDDRRVHVFFPVAINARFVRIRAAAHEWVGHISMRCGLLVPSSAPLHVLEQCASLQPGGNLFSPNGQYTACLEDGNFVAYRGLDRSHENALWTSGTSGMPSARLELHVLIVSPSQRATSLVGRMVALSANGLVLRITDEDDGYGTPLAALTRC